MNNKEEDMKKDKEKNLKDRFVLFRALGLDYEMIEKKLGVDKKKLAGWNKEFEIRIAELKLVELDKLDNEYYLMKEKRIKLFGELMLELKEELDSRDFEEMATKQLFDLFLKCYDVLRKEYTPPLLDWL